MGLTDFKTIFSLFILCVLLGAVVYLLDVYQKKFGSAIDFSPFILPTIEAILVILGAIIARELLLVVIEKSSTRHSVDLAKSLKTVINFSFFALTLLLIFAIFSKDLLVLTIFLAIAFVMVLYASRDLVEDFIIRLIFLATPSVNIGDYIETGEIKGRVQEFGPLFTVIKRDDNTIVCLPNKKLASSHVINYSKSPHLKLQDSLELPVSGNNAELIANKIQQELSLSGFDRTKVGFFQTAPGKTKFIAAINLNDPASTLAAHKTLTKVLKKIYSEFTSETQH
ncbi:Mechanosensitive ion channel [Candidatus Gugararchaeum adminiculabundum]|nr:Mechanosensitive ion channel [Candidatus Gugararchaeum adminiculabundum]